MGFLGFAIVYAMRVNLSVAIVAMVNTTKHIVSNDSTLDVCPASTPSNTSEPTVSFLDYYLVNHYFLVPEDFLFGNLALFF